MENLDQRLNKWAAETHPKWFNSKVTIGKSDLPGTAGPISASLGPVTCYGHTTNEVINALADEMIEEGWQDDRAGSSDG